jgi:UPF0042 nucleotide-binding protein
MRFVIITGMSGSGKRTAMKILEDFGYFCVDNLPVELFDKFTDLLLNSMGNIEKVAVVIDVRSGNIEILEKIIDEKIKGKNFAKLLFLDADNDVLIKRFKETRRTHPLSVEGRVDEGLELERKKLCNIKNKADYIVDTGNMLTRDLLLELEKIFVKDKEYKSLFINIVSFGFKHGIPKDADLVFDVRFLPNPFYIEELKHSTGNEKKVRDFVMDSEAAQEFLTKLIDMMNFLIPNYIKEGKHQLVIAIGCTGGKHRSVTIANNLYDELLSQNLYGVKVTHRDINNH